MSTGSSGTCGSGGTLGPDSETQGDEETAAAALGPHLPHPLPEALVPGAALGVERPQLFSAVRAPGKGLEPFPKGAGEGRRGESQQASKASPCPSSPCLHPSVQVQGPWGVRLWVPGRKVCSNRYSLLPTPTLSAKKWPLFPERDISPPTSRIWAGLVTCSGQQDAVDAKSQAQDWVCVNHIAWFLSLVLASGACGLRPADCWSSGTGNTLPAPSTPFITNQPTPCLFYSYPPETPAPHTHHPVHPPQHPGSGTDSWSVPHWMNLTPRPCYGRVSRALAPSAKSS